MPIPAFPTNLLTRPIAEGGTFALIPDETAAPGRASQTQGFPPETQLPLREGGINPNRTDFNGFLHVLSGLAFWQQSGGLALYRAAVNYTSPNIVFHSGQLWWCVADNGPDTGAGLVVPGTDDKYWEDFLTALAGMAGGSGLSGFGNPVGTVIMYHGAEPPDGYLACDGSSFSATTYPKLRALLGSTILPDMRGFFVRGYDTRSTVDPDGTNREIGSAQGDAIRNITGGVTNTRFYITNPAASGAMHYSGMAGVRGSGSPGGGNATLSFDASRVVPTSTENRPRNICLLYCIKHD